MKLYTGPLSAFGTKAEIAIAEKGLACETEFVPFTLRTRYSQLHAEVARINPKKQVPVLVDGDLEIFDSTQIFEYLEDVRPEPALWPPGARHRAAARLLELMSDEIFFPNVIALINAGANRGTPEALAALEAAQRYYDGVEALLADRDYLAGDYSYADIAFIALHYFACLLGAGIAPGHPRLHAWRGRVAARPAVGRILTRISTYVASNGLTPPDFVALD